MSYLDTNSAVTDVLESLASQHPELATEYNRLADFYRRKLWHQLTTCLLYLMTEDPSKTLHQTADGSLSFVILYNKVVLGCDAKLNQLSLCRLASAVATAMSGQKDFAGARSLLENLLEKRARLGVPAALYVESKLVLLTLAQFASEGSSSKDHKEEYETMKATLNKGESILNELEGEACSPIVPSAHYEASTAYRKLVGPPEAFYREALMYLNYTPVESMSKEEQFTLATDISLAALTGDGVFNFGEITTTPILASALGNTSNAWLMELMHCFAQGDVDAFQRITDQYSSAIGAQPALVSRAEVVKEKITLLALVSMVFERPSNERTLTFEEIASRTKLASAEKDVELLVMRALSLGLIKGCMDQVDQTLDVDWVMPRVLDETQLRALSERFGEWAVKVSKTREFMVENSAA